MLETVSDQADYNFPIIPYTLLQIIDKARQLDLAYVGKVSSELTQGNYHELIKNPPFITHSCT